MTEQKTEGGGAKTPDLKETLDRIERQYADLASARSMGRWIRLVVVLVILAIVLGQAWNAFATIKRTTVDEVDRAKLLALLTPELELVGRTAQRELLGMLEALKPVYTAELSKQADAKLPALQKKFMEEANQLGMDMAKTGDAMLKERLDRFAEQQHAMIAKEFDLEDPKKIEVVVTNLHLALRGALVEVAHERMTAALVRIVSVQDRAVAFLPKERREKFRTQMEKAWEAVGEQIFIAGKQLGKKVPEVGAGAKTPDAI